MLLKHTVMFSMPTRTTPENFKIYEQTLLVMRFGIGNILLGLAYSTFCI